MDSEIRTLGDSEFPLWDSLVDVSPQGTLFQQTFWLEASGEKFSIYGYFKGGDLVAGMPVVYESRLGARRAKHPALTPYLGVIFKCRETKYVNRISEEKEVSAGFARVLKRDFDSGYFRFSPGPVDLQPFIWAGFSPGVRYTYVIDLSTDLGNIRAAMNDKRRNDISKAAKDGITVVSCSDFKLTSDLVEKTFARQGGTAAFKSVAFSYDETLRQRGQCRAFLARNRDGEPIAVVYIVWDSRRSYYLLGGYDSAKSHHGASALAMWEAIQFTKKELGLGEFDFEGSMVPQIEQFFRKFGGRLTPYYTVSWARPYLRLLPPAARVAADRILARLAR